MKLRKAMGVLLTAAMTVSLAACGNNGGASAGASSTDGSGAEGGQTGGNGGGSISVAIWDNNQFSGLQKIADEWSEQSGVEVEFQVLDWSTYWTMLEAGVSGGEMPDVFWMHSAYSQMYTGANVLLDMNDYIANDDAIDLANYYPGKEQGRWAEAQCVKFRLWVGTHGIRLQKILMKT